MLKYKRKHILNIFYMCIIYVHIVTGRPYLLRGSSERPPDGLLQPYEAASQVSMSRT